MEFSSFEKYRRVFVRFAKRQASINDNVEHGLNNLGDMLMTFSTSDVAVWKVRVFR